MPDLNSVNIKKLYGVGQVRAASYARLGINTVLDLLLHYPRGYENRGDVRLLSEADCNGKTSVVLTVGTEPKAVKLKKRMTLVKFKAYDESGICEITYFNQEYLKNVFTVGTEFRFYGHVQVSKNKYTMASPAYEPYGDGSGLPPLVPIYPLTEGLTQKQLYKDIRAAMTLSSAADDTEDFLPEYIREKYSMCVHSYALRNIHNPDTFAALARARKRLIFDELFSYAVGITQAAGKSVPIAAPVCSSSDISEFTAVLPYKLTAAQSRALSDILKDMGSGIAMNRMVVGDVGCGKTVLAAAAIYVAVKNGLSAALMAPTEILATQHYGDLSELLGALGIRCQLLVGSLSAATKRKIRSDAAAGEIDVLIGTQALLSDGVELYTPGLVIVDEQHRFGVNQRSALAQKNSHSHMLVMSATPIPRSLALAMYGNLDVSVIDELPPGRSRVDTFAVDESYRDRLNVFIEKQVASGGQVYVVCPAVEECTDEEADILMSDIDGDGEIKTHLPLKSAVGYAKQLAEVFPRYRVEFLHGKMKSAEKDSVMKAFSDGEVNILVSTTVIEVGVNVPEACLMIVENADRFGLSQLHQLRGRVGRGHRKSYCVLVSDAINTEGKAKERLLTMKSCYDGFAIAEKDLLMRGPGDFLRSGADDSVRQSGGVRFRLAELCDDAELLHIAFAEAKELLSQSPELDEYPALRERVRKMFTPDIGTIN